MIHELFLKPFFLGLYLDSSLENYTLPCFRCADGRCISPIPLLYGSHGLPDWFLCDGISHCKDSSDEDDGKDMVMTLTSIKPAITIH